MKKYKESIYNKDYIPTEYTISLWEEFLLLFVRSHKVENEETISYYKQMFGKFYLMDFKIKDVV